MGKKDNEKIGLDSPERFLNRELSWLGFAGRVLAMAESPEVPLLERVRFVGIMGMLHDEFFMKRISGLKRHVRRKTAKPSMDGKTPQVCLDECRAVIDEQIVRLTQVVGELFESLAESGVAVRDYDSLNKDEAAYLRKYFRRSVHPMLTPLAVDKEHPFPFISNLGLNMAILLPANGKRERFVRLKVPGNRPRWIPLPDGAGYVPLEQVIAANLDLMFPEGSTPTTFMFRVTRGAEGERENVVDVDDSDDDDDAIIGPGSIVQQVTSELKARRFAGVVRLQVDPSAPKKMTRWLAQQLKIEKADVYVGETLLGLRDLAKLDPPESSDLRFAPHVPAVHPRLADLDLRDPGAIFEEIRQGDILLHHPYQSFDSSVLRFLESAASDPNVLSLKLTIYRTSEDSPIVRALVDAVRRGKQVAVLVEITARFDEAPNIAWGKYLEKEGVHVSYGVERLKTHVKLAMVVREEDDGVRRYLHAGTGNYHTGTARIYEDVGILTCDEDLCDDAANVLNALTGATAHGRYHKMLVAPANMRDRFIELIRREAVHAEEGRASGIRAKMNQLQDSDIIEALYEASRAGVPIKLYIRGLCCLRPGVPDLSETISVNSVVGRFLEHSRIYEFANAGEPETYIGSADWMRRNLSRRVETIFPVEDPVARRELERILDTHDEDNASAWDCARDGSYARRRPADGEPRRAVHERLIERAGRQADDAFEASAGARIPPSLRRNG